jgi:hypothetical protein
MAARRPFWKSGKVLLAGSSQNFYQRYIYQFLYSHLLRASANWTKGETKGDKFDTQDTHWWNVLMDIGEWGRISLLWHHKAISSYGADALPSSIFFCVRLWPVYFQKRNVLQNWPLSAGRPLCPKARSWGSLAPPKRAVNLSSPALISHLLLWSDTFNFYFSFSHLWLHCVLLWTCRCFINKSVNHFPYANFTSRLFWDKNELKTTFENRELGHNARSATSRLSLASSSLRREYWQFGQFGWYE